MFKITPIGSCRIATPLRLSRDAFGFQLNMDRVYGYTHSSAEAVQLMRYLRGEFAVDPMIEPLLSRRGFAEQRVPDRHETSDLYVIELSSAKLLRIGDTCIQLNYLNSEFAAFFAGKDRAARFWDGCEAGDQPMIDALLASEWSATAEQRQESEILRQIRRTTATEEDLRRDVRALIDGLPATLFVSHVNALTPDGKPIPSRSRFIRSVEAAVRAEGGVLYNPTTAMRRMGQAVAIEDNSDSLAHFTEDFSRMVFRDWFDLVIAAVMDRLVLSGGEEVARAALVPHVEARLAEGDGAVLTRRLERIAKAAPHSAEVRGLLANAYAAEGKVRAALKTLKSMPREALDGVLIGRRLALAIELNDLSELLGTLADLDTAALVLRPEERLAAAGALLAGGRLSEAAGQFRRAFCQDPSLVTAAEGFLELALSSESDLLAGLSVKERLAMAQVLSPGRRLLLRDLAGDRAGLVADLSITGQVAADDVATLVGRIEARGEISRAAGLVLIWRRAQGATRITHPGLRALIDGWVKRSVDLADHGLALEILNAALDANPQHVEARLQLRQRRKAVLDGIRTAATAGDLAALAVSEAAVRLLPDLAGEFGLHRMRILFSREDHPAAIAVARDVVASAPDTLAAWAIMMRSAHRSGDPATVDEAATRILGLADEDSRRLAEEAEERLRRLPALGFRAARAERDPLQAYRLFTIARRDPALARASELRLRRLEHQLASTLRDPLSHARPDFPDFSRQVVQLLPQNERVRLSMGRYHVKRRDYAAALPHWEHLAAAAPDNESYAFQVSRCRGLVAQAPHSQEAGA
jgi:tetratricopeptide (TPR) repeat protein